MAGEPQALSSLKCLKHCRINDNVGGKCVYTLMSNGQRHLMVSRDKQLDENTCRGGGATISVNEKTEYMAWSAGHLAQRSARANQLSCAGISTSDIQFSSLSNAIN